MTTHVVTRIIIGGMASVHSVRAVFTALGGVEGISRADVALGKATIEHDGRATRESIADALAIVGCELIGFSEERRRLPLA